MNNHSEKEQENQTCTNSTNGDINSTYMTRNSLNVSDGYFTVRQFSNEHLNGARIAKSQKVLPIENLNQIARSTNYNLGHRMENSVNNSSLSNLTPNSLDKSGMKLITKNIPSNMVNPATVGKIQYVIPNGRNEPKGIEADPSHSNIPASFSKIELKKSLPKRYFCEICNKAFARKHNLVSHVLVHSEEKPHVCSVCDIKFRRIHDLKRHEKLHVGTKPYACEKCSRCFARIDALTRHKNSRNACSGNTFQKSLALDYSSSSKENGYVSNLTAAMTDHTKHRQQIHQLHSLENHIQSSGRSFSKTSTLGDSTAQQEYVPIAKYRDLVSYTHELQNNLNRMNSRISVLERLTDAAGKYDEGSNLHRLSRELKELEQFPRLENTSESQTYTSNFNSDVLGSSNVLVDKRGDTTHH